MLVRENKLGHVVEVEEAAMVKRPEATLVEQIFCDSKYWHMLNVWVVRNRVRNDMVRVMRMLPPRRRDTRRKRSNHVADEDVPVSVVCDSVVGRIMPHERTLVHCGANSPVRNFSSFHVTSQIKHGRISLDVGWRIAGSNRIGRKQQLRAQCHTSWLREV